MATIVEHTQTGERFILAGTGYGAFQSTRPSLFFGNWVPSEDSGDVAVVAVCNREGLIGWIDSTELLVVEVDGKSPQELL